MVESLGLIDGNDVVQPIIESAVSQPGQMIYLLFFSDSLMFRFGEHQVKFRIDTRKMIRANEPETAYL